MSLLKGRAPILFAKPQLKALKAKLDFETDELILPNGKKIFLPEDKISKHYLLPICDFYSPEDNTSDKDPVRAEAEVLVSDPK